MTDLIQNITASIVFIGTFIVLVFFLICLIVYDLKAKDKEDKYLNSLSDEERLVIDKYKSNRRLRYKEFKADKGKENEDK